VIHYHGLPMTPAADMVKAFAGRHAMVSFELDPVIFSHLPLASADSCNVARNVGIDQAWNGPYSPRSRAMRALIMMDRIEAHASARCWSKSSGGVQHNLALIG